MENKLKPVVFACSGYSPAGQLANQLALELDRRGIAEMSYLAGLGAEKPAFIKLAERRPVWLIDGCPIECGTGIAGKVHRPADTVLGRTPTMFLRRVIPAMTRSTLFVD